MTAASIAAASVIVRRDDNFLLVLRANPPAKAMYAFPGGKAEAGESPRDNAIRELLEETGLKAETIEPFTVYDLIDRDRDGTITSRFHLSVFVATADAEAEPVAADDASALGWFSAEQVRRLPVPASVLECVDRLDRESRSSA
ncbi:NUDIX domain-containing protein [Martelella alba]|uniref:NUDIX domain-containing protein n=1 Tax=Martelella alba TaxID=2590451 RepID=A0A506UJC5_9HYPH|nr:NUDIX domain-containing protein [Martelella alba]TPW33431.1 NUDIX domain-containing protein [Martelella alba]